MCAWKIIFYKSMGGFFDRWQVFFMVSVQVWEVFMGNYFCSMGGFGWIWFVLKSMQGFHGR